MKVTTPNFALLLIIVYVLYFLQEFTLAQRNLAGGLCLLIGIIYLIKIVSSCKRGRISTGFPFLNWTVRFSTNNWFIGNTFERGVSKERFNSAVRASAYIAIVFVGFGLLVLLNIV